MATTAKSLSNKGKFKKKYPITQCQPLSSNPFKPIRKHTNIKLLPFVKPFSVFDKKKKLKKFKPIRQLRREPMKRTQLESCMFRIKTHNSYCLQLNDFIQNHVPN